MRTMIGTLIAATIAATITMVSYWTSPDARNATAHRIERMSHK